MEALLADPTLQLIRLPTTTTRAPRPEEKEGVQYHFLSEAEFETKIAQGEFFEWTRIYGSLYGTNKLQIQTLLAGTRPIICTLDMEGARAIKQALPDRATVILIQASHATLIQRLQERHQTDSLQARIDRIDRERALYPTIADVTIDNPDGALEKTVHACADVIRHTLAPLHKNSAQE